MVYLNLLLAIVCSASIALIFKWASSRTLNPLAVSAINYVAATSMSVLTLTQAPGLLNQGKALVSTLSLGFVTGLFFLGAFVVYQVAVASSGATLSGMYMKMGILVPMVLSLIFWKDIPTGLQTLGIAILLLAIVLSNSKKGMTLTLNKALILLFVVGGLAEFMNKLFQASQPVANKPLFLFATFFTAMVLSLALLVTKKHKITKIEFLVGLGVGVPNMLTSYFLISVLEDLSTAVAFSAYSAGTILVITLTSRLVFKEHLTKRTQAACFLTVLGLVLVNSL